jgi:uncharacterized protein
VPAAPLLVGSGVTAANATDLLAHADGAIIGSAFQKDGRAGGPVELARVQALLGRIDALRG